MKKIKLANGIECVMQRMAGFGSVAAGVWVRTGSRYETGAENGAAHFLEHLLFKGTEKRDGEETKRLVEGVGGEFNAFTSEEATCYYVRMPRRELLPVALDVLSDMVRCPLLPEAEVERERNVILEEIKMYQDIPQAFVQELFKGLLFPGHPLGRFVAGTPESVAGLSRADLWSYWRRFYVGPAMVVSVAGDIRCRETAPLLEGFFGPVPGERAPGCEAAGRGGRRPGFRFLTRQTEQAHFALGGRGFSYDEPMRRALSVLAVILGGNMSSRLFVEVREKRGLAYHVAASSESFADTGLFMIEAGTSRKTLKDALGIVLDQLRLVREEAVGAGELDRAKDFAVGQLRMQLENTADYMNFIGGQAIRKRKFEAPEQVIEQLNRVTSEDVARAARAVFRRGNLNLAVIGPRASRTGLAGMF